MREASWEGDIIIPAVPYGDQVHVASKIREVVSGKIVIREIPSQNPLTMWFGGPTVLWQT
jgi:predicted dinucleotide-binding enzyme